MSTVATLGLRTPGIPRCRDSSLRPLSRTRAPLEKTKGGNMRSLPIVAPSPFRFLEITPRLLEPYHIYLARQLAQQRRELQHREPAERLPVRRRDGDHHAAIHSRDLIR